MDRMDIHNANKVSIGVSLRMNLLVQSLRVWFTVKSVLVSNLVWFSTNVSKSVRILLIRDAVTQMDRLLKNTYIIDATSDSDIKCQ